MRQSAPPPQCAHMHMRGAAAADGLRIDVMGCALSLPFSPSSPARRWCPSGYAEVGVQPEGAGAARQQDQRHQSETSPTPARTELTYAFASIDQPHPPDPDSPSAMLSALSCSDGEAHFGGSHRRRPRGAREDRSASASALPSHAPHCALTTHTSHIARDRCCA